MKNIREIHTEHNELLSKSSFLKTEIDFMLKMVQKEYSNAINSSKINLLDNYWEMLERNMERANTLTLKIKKGEETIVKIYQQASVDIPGLLQEEEENILEMEKMTSEIALIKESLFEFLNPKNKHEQ